MTPGGVPPVIRTDFSDDAAWADLVKYFATERDFPGIGAFTLNVQPIDDHQYAGMTLDQLLALAPDEDATWTASGPSAYSGEGRFLSVYAYVADSTTFSNPEHPLLAVNFFLDHGEHFRLTAASMVPVDTNLSIANLSFSDFIGAAALSPDGILHSETFD